MFKKRMEVSLYLFYNRVSKNSINLGQPFHPQIENYVEFIRLVNKYRHEVIM